MAQPATASGGVRQAFALVQTGQRQLGIAAEHVVQAMAWPADLTALPRAGAALEGVFVHNGQVIPLVSIERWFDPAAAPARQGAQVLVLRSGGKVMGVVVDALMGLLHAGAAQVHRVHQDNDALELFHSVVQRPSGAGLVSLLDPERLAGRVQAWCDALPDGLSGVGEESGLSVQPAPGTGRAQRGVFLLARVGPVVLGFPAGDIGEIVSMPLLQKPLGPGTHLGGMACWRGIHVPVVDTTAVPGMPASDAGPAPWLLVLASHGRHAAVPVDQLLAVQSFDLAGLQAPEGADAPGAGLHRGSFSNAGERVRIIDTDRFLDRFALQGLASVGEKVPHTGARTVGSAALLVFRSLQSWAASMEHMQHITRFPGQVKWSDGGHRAVLGAFEWRGKSVNLVDLRLLHGRAATVVDAATRVLVLQVGQRLAGLVVEDVVALLPAHTCIHTRFVAHAGRAVHMVTVGEGAAQTSHQVMDFGALECLLPA